MSEKLSRTTDHLGSIGRTLKNELAGYTALAFELIQNADDADCATQLRFDIREEALWVEDNGGFTDCGNQKLPPAECPFLEDGQPRHRCDFHSFRLLSGADKQLRENTTGAFGIGFTAVYQVTDSPEIVSGTRHWIVDETAAENDRITQHRLDPPHKGTRIKLPWAQNPNSEFRRKASVAAVPEDVREQLRRALDEALAHAMLFLRKLRRIEVALDGQVVRCVTRRKVNENEVIVDDGEHVRRWRLLRGSFQEESARLRDQHGNLINAARKPDVAVAIPLGFDVDGLLCATLPTAQFTKMPVHVNAELYLTSNRRELAMGTQHQSDWNTVAIGCAAHLLTEALGELPALLGPERLWTTLEAARGLAQIKHPDAVTHALTAFWRRLEPELPNLKLAWTSDGRWVTIGQARFVEAPEDEVAFPLLQELGIALVHPDLRVRRNILRAVGVRPLGLPDVATALRNIGLDEPTPIAKLPRPLDNEAALEQLWSQLGRMIDRLGGSRAQTAAIEGLGDTAVVPSTLGNLCPIEALWQTNAGSVELLSAVCPEFPFLDQKRLPEEATPPLSGLCDLLDASGAVAELNGGRLQVDANLARKLIGWLAQRENELDEEDRTTLSGLVIFPSANGVHPLADLALPGDFEDQLGLALLVERETAKEYGNFLIRLGIRPLSFAVYARDHVPRVFAEGNLPVERRRAVVLLLAERRGQLDDAPQTWSALAAAPLVECTDGVWRLARNVYFDRAPVAEVLGSRPPRAKLPAEQERAVEAFLTRLGVAHEPRAADVVHRVRELASREVHDSRKGIGHVVNWIGRRWVKLDDKERQGFLALRNLRWLPARGRSAWYSPDDLDLVFTAHLYESQGRFLDLEYQTQTGAVDFLGWLGLDDNPDTWQVVAHLRHCARTDNQPNRAVYDFLNAHAQDPAVAKLRNVECLRIDGRWCLPTEVYWSDHPFGRWRLRLGSEFARYRALLDALGVKEEPGHDDAMKVIVDVSKEYLPYNQKVPDEDRSVLFNCWRLCEAALSSDELRQEELAAFGKGKVIPDGRGVLMEARHLFFEDLPGLADELSGIRSHIIQRPDGAWRAMHASGVRDLSKVAVARVVERGDRLAGEGLRKRVAEREEGLARVIAPRSKLSWRQVAEPMRELRLIEVTSLMVAWELEAFSRRFPGKPRPADALWQEQEGALYVAVVDGDPVWEAVARELVRALLPEIEPATLALDIAAALSAPTPEAAKRALDAAGFPPLAREIRAQISTTTATNLDAEDAEQPEFTKPEDEGRADGYGPGDDHYNGDAGRIDPRNSATRWDEEQKYTGETEHLHGGTETRPDLHVSNNGEGSAEGREGSLHGTRGKSAGRGADVEGNGSANGSKPSPSRSRNRLRSYVVKGDSRYGADEPQPDAKRSVVDEAGVRAVVRLEKGEGRRPIEKPHNNPGYDVLSSGQDEEIARYVEVKSSEGPWDELGIGLSSEQFAHAQETGDLYWLYVVEYALDDERRTIWRIPDPARRVTDFMFDAGWKDAVEHGEAGSAENRRDIRFKEGVRL